MRRRPLLAAGLALALPGHAAPVAPGRGLVFPRDHGAHPEQRTEWWYATGWLAAPGTEAPAFGFQVTFFRSRTGVAEDHPSRFAARQLLFAHAALTDLDGGRLLHDQRIGRAGFGNVAAEKDTGVALRGWRFERHGPVDAARYRAHLDSEAGGFAFDLELTSTQPLLLQGDAGYSRKGPRPGQASHYYSQPQLAVRGTLTRAGRPQAVQGRAWLDHEWSDEYLAAEASGWDWVGLNLFDGGALTAFRLRRPDGSVFWAGGSHRPAGGAVRAFAPDEVQFEAGRTWTSPASRTTYPVQWRLVTPAGEHTVRALLDAQELDSRESTGAIYWEGLSELLDAGGRRVGLGYLEMTGRAERLRM
ncbi:MAG: carotenoid 1,2-hydratase [Piscinibacter sp.]|nr:carotenoid 1,2-hydratase [Piscinibacter sp.]